MGSTALPNEAIIEILEILHEQGDLDSGWRLVSRVFDELITPIQYRHIDMAKHHITAFRNKQVVPYDGYVANLRQYTEEVAIGGFFEWPSVIDLLCSLRELKRLYFIDWAVFDGRTGQSPAVARATLLPVLFAQWPKLEVSIENFDASTRPNALEPLMSIPLTALKISEMFGGWGIRSPFPNPTLEDLLCVQQSLQILHLVCKSRLNPPCLLFFPLLSSQQPHHGAKKRFPALRELLIDLDREDFHGIAVPSLWDFSRLESLTLRNFSIVGFLVAVETVDFPRLKHFSIDDWGASRTMDSCRTISELIFLFVNKISTLQSVKLTAMMMTLSDHGAIDLCCKHLQSNLRVLDIREPGGFSSIDAECEGWSTDDLAALRVHCPKIMELVIDYDMKNIDTTPSPFLPFITRNLTRTLSKYLNLRRLTIHISLLIRSPTSKLHAQETAKTIIHNLMMDLLKQKQGVAYESLVLIAKIWTDPPTEDNNAATATAIAAAPPGMAEGLLHAYARDEIAAGPTITMVETCRMFLRAGVVRQEITTVFED